MWVDHPRGDATPGVARLREIIADEEALLAVCDTARFEVLRGVRHDVQAARVERGMRRFRVEPVSAGPDDAARWRAMRAKGLTAGHADTQIGSWCLDRGHRLLHDDSAFDCMEALLGLPV